LKPLQTESNQRSKKRNILSRQLIVSTALEIVDNEGLQSLSMRRVGKELNVSPGALYPYIESKEKLTQALIDAIFQEVNLEIFNTTKWQQSIRSMGQELRRIFLKHQDLVSLTLGRIPIGPNFAIVLEKMMATLVSNGVPGYLGFYVGDIIGLYTAAFVYEEYLQKSGENQTPTGEQNVSDFRDFLASLPEKEFPNIHRAAVDHNNNKMVDRYEFGLDVLIQGLEATFEKKMPINLGLRKSN
jgi:AcrR family transcriptional regulator